MMSSLFIVGIPRITGTMEVFDSYPAICFAYTVGIKRTCFMKNHQIFWNISVSGPETEEEKEENDIEDEEKENKNQLLFFKDFKSFLIVLKEYYFLCMVRCYQ